MTFAHMGMSGCKLELVDENVIRKISPSPHYNPRLELQLNKQINFSNISSTGFFTPKIINSGYTNELFFFEMEYINGKLFTTEFERISKDQLNEYVMLITSYLKNCKLNSSGKFDALVLKNLILNKLHSLYDKSNYKFLINNIIEFVDTNTFPPVSISACHGDLTFSNILFSKNKIYVIDFLDSYIDSYVMDIVKLKQDLVHNWYLNGMNIDANEVTRIKQIFNYMWKHIEIEFGYIINTVLFDILDVINFLRIEPYITTQSQSIALQNAIGGTRLYEKFNSTNDG